jgi:hypothetical protein
MEHDHSSEVRRIVLSVVEDCVQCHQRFSLDDMRVVGRNGNLWVLAVRCPECATQSFVAAVVGEHDDGTTVEAAAIDLIDEEDAFDPVFEDVDPVTVDDVLDMHQFLDTFDGNFLRHFNRRR